MALTQHDLESLFRRAPGPVVVYDARFAIVAANDAFFEVTRASRDILGRSVFEAFPENPEAPEADGPESLRASLARIMATGEPDRLPVVRYDIPRPASDGGGFEERYWAPSSYPVLGDDGRVAFIVHQTSDVTERLHAERDHRATKILESITDAFYSVDREWRFTYLNGQSERQLRRARGELLGRVVWVEFPAALGTTFEREYRRAMTERCPVTFEEHYPAPLDRWYEVNAYPTEEGLAVYFRDVTERRAAQEQLGASERRFRALVTATSDVVYRMNADWSEMHHLVGREFVEDTTEPSRDWLAKYIPPDDRPTVVEAIREAIRARSIFQLEHRIMCVGGAIGWTLSRAVPILDDRGELVEWFGTASDVTRRKEAEAERARIERESERQRRIYEAALSNTPDLVYIFDLAHRFLYANEALLAMWGRTREEALGKSCLELGYEPWHAALHDREIDEVVATRRPIRGEVPFTGTNGRRIYDYIFVPVVGADGSVVAVAGTTRDVTERQEAAEALRESEARFRLAQLAANVGTYDWDLATDDVVWSEGIFNAVGLEPGSLRPTRDVWLSFVHPDDRDGCVHALQEAIATGGEYDQEFRVVLRGGEVRWLASTGRAVYDQDGRPTRFLGVDFDITKRKLAEQAAREHEERFRQIADNLPGGAIYQAIPAGPGDLVEFPYVSCGMERLFGFTRDELAADPALLFGLFHEDDRARVEASNRRSIEQETPFDEQFRSRTRDGAVRWVHARSAPRATSAGLVWDGVVIDITAQKFAEEELRRSEGLLRLFLESSPMPMGLVELPDDDRDVLHVYDNPATCEFFGVATGTTIGRWSGADLGASPETIRAWVGRYRESQGLGRPLRFVHEHVAAEGPAFLEVVVSHLGPAPSGRARFCYIAQDITQRKRSEDELRRSEERFSKAFTASPDALCITRLSDGLIHEVNESYLHLFGFCREEVIGSRTIDLGIYSDPEDRTRGVERFVAQGRLRDLELSMSRKSGEIITTRSSVEPIEIGGEPYLLSIIRDVTEARRAEEALRAGEAKLRESEVRFRLLVDGAPVAIGMSRLGHNLYVNPTYRRCFGIDPDEPIEGRSILDEIVPEEHERIRGLVRARYAGEATESSYEFKGLRRDGTRFPVQVEVGQIELPDGPASLAFLIDLTERRRAEREIRRSEAKFRFLATIDAETRALTDPDQVTAVTARLLAEHLNVDRCAYAEVEDQAVFVITGDHNRGVASIVGRWPIEAFGAACTRAMLANEPFVAADIEADSRIDPGDRPAYGAIDTRAVIWVPLHKEGKLSAAMAVHQKTPRRWDDDEVALARLVVSRCWESLERTRVTRSLEQSEERFRLFMEHSPASAWICDTEGLLEYLSPAYYRMFQLPDGDLVGRSVFDVYPREIAEPYVANMRRVIEDGQAIEVVEDGLLPDGKPGKFLSFKFPLPVQDGRKLVGGVAVDITDRVVAERRLTESEQRYRTLAENVQQLFWTCLPDGHCDYLSHQWIRYTGIPAEEQLGLAWLSVVVHPDDRARTLQVWMDAVADRGPYDVNYRIRGVDGEYRWFKTRGTPIRDAAGTIVKWFGTCTDIDAQVRAEEALREADRKKDEFLAMLAHELRNPLSAIGNAVQLSRRSEASEHQEWSREVIEKHVGSLSRMIDDLLDVSRITRGKIELRRRPLEVPSVMAHAVETVRPLVQERGHELTVTHASSSLWVDADPHRLEQVLVNLLTNAAKYTEPGGRIAFAARPEGDSVAFTVADNGSGIPPGKIADMFELFTQGDRSIARSEGGLGIGLTIVKSLVEMHGGSVVARSEGPGQGSEFTVRIPAVAPPTPERLDRSAAAPTPARTRARVLVVDDNRDSAVGLARLLKVLGNDVEIAHDGPSALGAAHRHRPDYVLLDIGLPGMDGYEVAETLRAEGFRDAVIIAISGYGEEAARRRSREAGFDHHLVKPVDYDRLVAIMKPAD